MLFSFSLDSLDRYSLRNENFVRVGSEKPEAGSQNG
jgi:hypothetical protein